MLRSLSYRALNIAALVEFLHCFWNWHYSWSHQKESIGCDYDLINRYNDLIYTTNMSKQSADRREWRNRALKYNSSSHCLPRNVSEQHTYSTLVAFMDKYPPFAYFGLVSTSARANPLSFKFVNCEVNGTFMLFRSLDEDGETMKPPTNTQRVASSSYFLRVINSLFHRKRPIVTLRMKMSDTKLSRNIQGGPWSLGSFNNIYLGGFYIVTIKSRYNNLGSPHARDQSADAFKICCCNI